MNQKQTRHPNRLGAEKSPYLHQHAMNPVDWYPWGDEAFERARREEKPIFLSIGYSTCHWCHVMERESFENEAIARILNERFVAIKVDREERPDVDRVYMTALQGMGQNGGWPMSMFLTPDLKPFYGGTYFPPETRYGRAGFPDVLLRVHQVWTSERDRVLESAESITSFLQEAAQAGGRAEGQGAPALHACFEQLRKTYDPVFGGFGAGPKFPRPAVFQFLLRHHGRTGNRDALDMTARSFRTMALGGVHDHIGGGFHRYAVDAEWRVPHFEKMLYDQAQLLETAVEIYRVTKDPFFADVARGTAAYVLRDLRHPDGGFYSAEDADSPRPEDPEEAGEGAFYVWTSNEVHAILGEDAELFRLTYGVENQGNATVDPQHEFTGRNILYEARSVDETARLTGRSPDEVRTALARSRRQLTEIRAKRPRPHRDEKIVTGWNGLMLGALARAGAALGDRELITAAVKAADFICSRMLDRSRGKLFRRYSDGEVRFDGQLQDYAFLIHGLLDLFTCQGAAVWLEKALRLTELQERVFAAPGGGYFDSPGDDPSVIVRMKELYDGAEPSGNAIAARNLLRLARITGEQRWESRARATVDACGGVLSRQPVAVPAMAAALEDLLLPPQQIVVVESEDEHATGALLREVYARYLPAAAVIRIRPGDETISRHVPGVVSYGPIDGKPAVYVCQDFVCRMPVTDPVALGRLLDGETGYQA